MYAVTALLKRGKSSGWRWFFALAWLNGLPSKAAHAQGKLQPLPPESDCATPTRIAELSADPCARCRRASLRQTRLRHGSDSDGGGTGAAGAAQPGDRTTRRYPSGRRHRRGARSAAQNHLLHIGKTQHVSAVPEITTRRQTWPANGSARRQLLGTLPAYEVRVLIEKYRLGANTIIVPLNSTNDRMIGTQKGTIDATVGSGAVRLDRRKRCGLSRLLHMGTILPIPQAGLATTDEKIKNRASRDYRNSQGDDRRTPTTYLSQREGTERIIAKWMKPQASAGGPGLRLRARDFLQERRVTEEQAQSLLTMLGSTAGLKGDLPAAADIPDFPLPQSGHRARGEK